MRKPLFGIQVKLVVLLVLILVFLSLAGYQVFRGLSQIEEGASIITDRETPFVRTIEEALSAMITAENASEQGLDVDDPAQLDNLKSLEQTFETENRQFRMFIAAITWGSETDAFAHSDDGANYAAWNHGGLKGKLIVEAPDAAEAQLAAQAGVYYEGFVNNVRKAFAAREEYLSLSEAKKANEATAAKNDSKSAQTQARSFSALTAQNLRLMVQESNQTTTDSANSLLNIENTVIRDTTIALIVGFLLCIIVGFVFSERVIVMPINSLVRTAQAFGSGMLKERATIRSRDEFQLLANAFNDMADKVAHYTTGLQEEVEKRTKELTDANARLLELDKIKSDFISVAAHQLRTPLSALKWVLGILKDEGSQNLTPEQRSLVLKGAESNERMVNLINEMLVVTRIESGKERFAFVPLHVEDIIENTMIDFAGQAHVRRINLNFDKPLERLGYISADPQKIRDVMQNLIENAMRYTLDGGSITVRAVREENMAHVSVADTGIGIPDAQKPNIFNKFFRADNAVKLITDGSGLGLFIAKSIIEKHGGTLTFESSVGKGTTFHIRLPMSTPGEDKTA